jgi:hypothetical protein
MMQLRKIKRVARGLPEGQRRLLTIQLQGLEAERVYLRQQLKGDPTVPQRQSKEEGKERPQGIAKPLSLVLAVLGLSPL